MQAFSDSGIYLFLDVDTFTTMIVQTNPQWTTASFANFTKVIDAFDKYDNLAGFFISNEGVNTQDGTAAAPYIKAAVRDTKAYMKSKGGRYIPMGYSAADIASIRPMFQDYLVCGPVENTIDFFAVNIYEWVNAYNIID
jgi:1,3-beta-glucanosyltransferase GAS1